VEAILGVAYLSASVVQYYLASLQRLLPQKTSYTQLRDREIGGKPISPRYKDFFARLDKLDFFYIIVIN
jgi:hypothetical protein